MSDQLITIQSRECSGCTMCCKLPELKELQKPRDTWCAHCAIGKGCTIYSERPQGCITFECMWKQGFMPVELKPDEAKVVFWQEAENRVWMWVDQCIERIPRKAVEYIDRFVSQGVELILCQPGEEPQIYLPKLQEPIDHIGFEM